MRQQFVDEHLSEMQHYYNKIDFEQRELERLERQKDELKQSKRVYSGRDELSQLNYLR